MKVTVKRPVTMEVLAVRISVAVRYGTEDMPEDFPFREGDLWTITVDIESGAIRGWPGGHARDLFMKVCDQGTYTLLGPKDVIVAELRDGYVPHGVVPGEYGDYIALTIQDDGVIANWKTLPDVTEFFAGEGEKDD
jgi:hypothetical protein